MSTLYVSFRRGESQLRRPVPPEPPKSPATAEQGPFERREPLGSVEPLGPIEPHEQPSPSPSLAGAASAFASNNSASIGAATDLGAGAGAGAGRGGADGGRGVDDEPPGLQRTLSAREFHQRRLSRSAAAADNRHLGGWYSPAKF